MKLGRLIIGGLFVVISFLNAWMFCRSYVAELTRDAGGNTQVRVHSQFLFFKSEPEVIDKVLGVRMQVSRGVDRPPQRHGRHDVGPGPDLYRLAFTNRSTSLPLSEVFSDRARFASALEGAEQFFQTPSERKRVIRVPSQGLVWMGSLLFFVCGVAIALGLGKGRRRFR